MKQPIGFATKGHGRKRKVYPIYRGYKGMPRGGGMQVSSVVEAQQLRTPMARKIDAQSKAPIAKSNEQWLSEPNRYDLPGVDTPTEKAIEQTSEVKSFRMQRLDEIEKELDATNDREKLITLRREAHEIWKDEHDFGLHDKEARKVYDKINVKLDTPQKQESKDAEFEKWLETNEAQKAYTNQIMIDNKAGNKLRNWEEFKKIPEAKAAFEKSKQTPPISKVEGSNATYNKATGWMALSFSSIPDPEIRAEMKQNGFRYNPVRKQWVAKWYPYREELAKKYAGSVEQVDIKPNWAAKAEHAASMAAKHETKANETFNRAEKMSDVIPFGQPILVGHHSERSDRNYRDRIQNTYRKSFEENKIAEKYADRAARYGEKATGESPGLIYRRIQKLEADKRKMERNHAEAVQKKSKSGLEWSEKWLNEYNTRLTIEKEKYKASGGIATDTQQFKPGDIVFTRHGIGKISTISKKTARIRLDSDTGIYTNRKQESLMPVDSIKQKLTEEQIQKYKNALKEANKTSYIL